MHQINKSNWHKIWNEKKLDKLEILNLEDLIKINGFDTEVGGYSRKEWLLMIRSFVKLMNISLYPFLRIGGFGLGNMLFPFFRSLFLSIKDGAILMYPHHFQIQPRNLLFNLNINSVRNYSSDFSKLSWCSLPKNKSAYIFYKKRWESENEINNASNIYFSGLKNYFFDLIDFQEEIQEFIYHSFSYKPKIRMNVVAFHLRLGDFIRNKQAINREKIINTFDFFLKQSKIRVKND